MDATPLVEREGELEAVEELLAGVRAGAGGTLLIEGPAGIGKSSLLAAARGMAGDVRVASARASELEREFPLGVLRKLLEPVLASTTEDESRALLAGAGALGAAALDQPHAAPGEPAEIATVLHGLYWLAVNLASLRPVILLVDDVQWADLTSLRWLAYIAARLDGVPLGLLAAVRLGEPTAGQLLLDELALAPEVRVIRPEALTEPAVAELARRRLERDPARAFVRACALATGGNPFLVGELLGEMARTRVEPSAGNAALVRDLNPSSVARDLRARLRRLPPACRALARAVAVLGDDTQLGDAARLAGVDGGTGQESADRLASAGLLEPRRPLAFVHPLVRASVYAELSPGERAAWHARAVDLLLAAGAATDRVAVHLLRCEPRGDANAARILREAADGARRRGAEDIAVAYLRRALAEPPPAELEAELLYELGAAELSAAEVGPATDHLGRATRALSGRAKALAAAELGSALAFTNRPLEGVVALNEAIAALPEGERELGLVLQVARAMVAPVSLDAWRSLEAAGERFDTADDEPATPGERLQIAELALQACFAATAERARDLARTALGEGRLLAEPGPLPLLAFKAPIALFFSDALEEATQVFGQILDGARRAGSPMLFAQASHLRAAAWLKRGALAEAEADAESALRYPSPQLRPAPLTLVEIRLFEGDVAGAAAVWEASGLDDDRGSSRSEVTTLQTRARLLAAQGRVEQALADLERCGQLEEAWRIRTPALSTWRSDAARLLAGLGRQAEADALARAEIERCRAFGAPRPLAAALRAAAAAVGRDQSLELLKEAVELLGESPARLDDALARYELGAELRRAGRRAAARERLTEALELALACGASAVATRSHDELVAAGARPRRDPIESRSNLTASELRVAGMAAGGMTNREIAQALFLTEKTIENHLRSVYRKLSIGSRSQLARALPQTAAA